MPAAKNDENGALKTARADKITLRTILFCSLCCMILFCLPCCTRTFTSADLAAGERAFDKRDYAAALNEFLPLAKQGNPKAQCKLGFMYESGLVVTRVSGCLLFIASIRKSGSWWQRHFRSLAYQEAAKEAVKWYRRAADQGDGGAQYHLAIMYEYGQGVPQDHQQATKWYRQAANHGEIGAQYHLGIMYEYGQGVPQDYVQAHMWYNLAAVSSDAESVERRDSLTARMTSMQIAEAQRLAREWTH